MGNDILNLLFGLFSVILILVIYSTIKMRKARLLETQITQLNRSLQESDEQAKLIIKTDLELNKTQEALDKKVAGLFTLQKISQALATTLQEEEIFERIKTHVSNDLGFEKSLLFSLTSERKLVCRIFSGYKENEMFNLSRILFANNELISLLSEKKSVSSLTRNIPEIAAFVKKNLGVEVFVITGLVTKNGLEGVLFLGNESASLMITEGEEELIAILSTQIVQAIENARLFEQTWRAQQDLEIKVKERTQELSKALEDIKEVSKRKTDFILAVSHELRTPLTSVKGYASLILAGTLGDIPEEIKSRLEKINEHSDKLTALIENLLDISRIEAGRVKMNLQPLDLKTVLTKLAEMFTIQLKEKEVVLELDIPDASPVLADSMQLERVFINLISNAAKFTPKKGFIRVKVKDIPDFLEISVSDTGIGIPKDNVPFIFQEFFRASNAIDQKIKGTGLGLSLVKQIVEAHQGKISFETKEGAGTTFTFTIPKAK